MTAHEREMLQLFRRLNATGQDQALNLVHWYTTRPEYTRTGSAEIIPFRKMQHKAEDIRAAVTE